MSESDFYSRQARLPGFTAETQERLRRGRALVVGVGGLGCPASLYMCGAGVGHIGLCDFDIVSESNLHRQILFDYENLGEKKAHVAASRLAKANPYITVEPFDEVADAASLARLVADFDVVIDGTDNFNAKYALDDVCRAYGKALVYGSIFQFEGQVSVFHSKATTQSAGWSYRDLFADAPPLGLGMNCGEAGVIGVLPGIVGALQANEAIKLLSGLGEPLCGTLLTFNALTGTFSRFALSRRSGQSARESIGAEVEAWALAPADLADRISGGALLIDVREQHEHQRGNLGGINIPLNSLPQHVEALPQDRDIVVYCKSGARSAKALRFLRSRLPHAEVFSLIGGMDATPSQEIPSQCSACSFVPVAMPEQK